MMATAVVVAVAAGGITEILTSPPGPASPAWGPGHPIVITLPTRVSSYIGAYAAGVPDSYAPINSFKMTNGVRPNIAAYTSDWGEPFKSAFAIMAAGHHAVPLVQLDPGHASIAAIAGGRFDSYLRAFGDAVGDFGQRTGRGVIIGFGEQPNCYWRPWSYQHVRPGVWVRAWRHIVTLFRREGADDVTWLWTVTAIGARTGDVSPRRWWPGRSYVTWVGIDGYYYRPSTSFVTLFGRTIRVIHGLTSDPILVSETAAQDQAGKVVKIADVFHGVRSHGLLGLVWFNLRRWRLDTRASADAFAAAASTWHLTD